jgi:ribosomal protein S18 acetylase RimI-like enzyme
MLLDDFHIGEVTDPTDLQSVIALFRDYAASLEIDLSYQDFEGEMAAMPGRYAPPLGKLLLARHRDGMPAGCVALRPLEEPGTCEMKRLYVAPRARGVGLGRSLAAAIMGSAEQIGYAEIRLDTLPSMAQALEIYRALGFEAIAPYYETPVAGTVFLRRILQPRARVPLQPGEP